MEESPEEVITKIAAVVAVLAIAGFVFWLFGSTIRYWTKHLFLYGLIIGLGIGSFAMYSTSRYVIPWWKNRFIPWLRNI